jgi:hypothetical protein
MSCVRLGGRREAELAYGTDSFTAQSEEEVEWIINRQL